MAEFDPDAYLKKKTAASSGFNPDAYLAKKAQPAPDGEKMSASMAALHGAGQGASFGFTDELAGLVGKLLLPESNVKLGSAAQPAADDTPEMRAAKREALQSQAARPSNYELVRDLVRAEHEKARKDQGAAYTGGEVGGAVLTALLPGGAAAQGARGATVGANIGRAALIGAGTGAVYGAGASDADLVHGDVAGFAGDVVAGAGFGAAGGAVGQAVAPYLQKGAQAVARPVMSAVRKGAQHLEDAARSFGAERALKAAGYTKLDIKPIARDNPEEVIRRGLTLLDEPGLITGGASKEAVADRLAQAVDHYGAGIGKILDAADNAGGKFNVRQFTDRVRRELLDPLRVGPQGQFDPAKQHKAEALERLIQKYEAMAGQPGLAAPGTVPSPTNFSAANKLKSHLQDEINYGNRWNEAAPDHQEYLKGIAAILLDEVDGQLQSQFGRQYPQLRQMFAETKRRYGTMLEARQAARKGIAGEVGNNFTSMRGKMIEGAVAGGGVIPAILNGSPEYAVAAWGLGKAASIADRALMQRGSSTAAAGSRGMAAQLAQLRQALQLNPGAFGRFGPSLQRAALAGDQQLGAMHYVLSQRDPEYRQMQERMAQAE